MTPRRLYSTICTNDQRPTVKKIFEHHMSVVDPSTEGNLSFTVDTESIVQAVSILVEVEER